MRKIILTLMGAALIAGATGQVAFSKERHHTYAAPYLLPQAPSGVSGGMSATYGMACPPGMYPDNDLNVYRDGQCREDYDVNPNGG